MNKKFLLGLIFWGLVGANLGALFNDNLNDININCTCDDKSCSCLNSDGDDPCKFDGPYGFFMPRAQGVNSAFLFNPFLHRQNLMIDDSCGYLNLGYRFTRSTHGEKIATSLFGANNLEFQGGFIDERSDKALVAEWFGLNPLYSGTISFDPRIDQHHVDFNLIWRMGSWYDCLDGGWISLSTTLVHSKWDLRADIQNETISNEPKKNGIADNYPLYMSKTGNAFAKKLENVLDGQYTFGDMAKKWDYGKFDLTGCGQKDTKLANVDLILGYDFITCDDYHLTGFIKAVAPTGTRLDETFAEYIFNPIIGNGHHWELGVGFNTHWDFWECDHRSASVHFAGSLTHLFKNKTMRSFDFKKYGPLSRYMLLKELDDNNEYTGELINAINYTTRWVDSSFSVQGDATLQLLYRSCGWVFGCGYNIYGRSQEEIGDKRYEKNLDCRNWGIKGNTGAYYLTQQTDILPLNATQALAQSLSATSVPDYSDYEIDNKGPLITGSTTWDDVSAHKSVPPVLIDPNEDINYKKPLQRQIVHKLFAHVDYQWDNDCCNYAPYVGIYGEYDFTSRCDYASPSQWGVGIRGGISF